MLIEIGCVEMRSTLGNNKIYFGLKAVHMKNAYALHTRHTQKNTPKSKQFKRH